MDRMEKGIAGSGDRKSRGLEGKTADQGGKTAGSESKVQIRHQGWSLLERDQTKKTPCWKKRFNPDFFLWVFDKQARMSSKHLRMRVSFPFDECSFL